MENQKEDILKKFLQDTFSDYEPEPTDASWSTIFSAIQPNKPTFWGKSKPYIASVFLILMGVTLWYSSANVEANNSEIAFSSNKSKETVAVKKAQRSDDSQTDKLHKLENTQIVAVKESEDIQAGQSNKSERKQVAKTKYLDDNRTIQIVENQNVISSKNIQEAKIESEITKYPREITVKNNTPKEEVENHPTVEKRSDETVVSTDNLTASVNERMGTTKSFVENTETHSQAKAESSVGNTETHSQTEAESSAGNPEMHSQTRAVFNSERVEKPASDVENTSIIEQVRHIRPMESLRNKDFILTKIALNSPVIAPIITPNREAKPIRQHTYLNMSITPIQTYRILTINNQNVQNVQTSKLFDSERNGWQFDLGMMKPIGKLWNFRVNMSYLRMRQWSEYQISTDELVLRNTNNGYANQSASNTLEVVGQTVTESKNLHMVGLKMDVQKFFRITPKNRYFISTGTQLMYENTQKQSNLFLNISAGFQHIVSPTTFITIEPIASYSLNNFNDSKSLLQANGYNLGLKMGVSFKVK